MPRLSFIRVIAALTNVTMVLACTISTSATAQIVEQETSTPAATTQAADCNTTTPAAEGANDCQVAQSATVPQPTQPPPPQPIPVPPIEPSGGSLHVGPVLLGVAAVAVGVGLYFLLHHKSSNDSGGTTTP